MKLLTQSILSRFFHQFIKKYEDFSNNQVIEKYEDFRKMKHWHRNWNVWWKVLMNVFQRIKHWHKKWNEWWKMLMNVFQRMKH
jgi:hypothetical protein